MIPRMTFDEWLRLIKRTEKRSALRVAQELDVNKATVVALRKGRSMPNMRLAQRIHELSGGKVGLMDWPSKAESDA